jgi:hypothetical protein
VTPSALVRELASIKVVLEPPNRDFHANVHRYKSGNPAVYQGNSNQAQREAGLQNLREREQFNQRLQSDARSHFGAFHLTPGEVHRVFLGLGTIVTIRRTLQLCARAQIFDPEAPRGLGSHRDLHAALTHVVDRYIGLDCTGFTALWAELKGLAIHDRTATPTEYMRKGVPRQTLAEVHASDVVLWVNNTHIAVIDHCGTLAGTRRQVFTGESNGRGIGIYPTQLRMMGGPADRIRGASWPRFELTSAPHNTPQAVYIASLIEMPH